MAGVFWEHNSILLVNFVEREQQSTMPCTMKSSNTYETKIPWTALKRMLILNNDIQLYATTGTQ